MKEGDARQLPEGWELRRLGDVAEINPQLDRSIGDDETAVTFVPMRAVDPEGGGLVRPESRAYREVKKGYTSFRSGDVIMAKITPCMENGKTTVVPHVPGDVCFGSTEFHVIRPVPGVAASWIAHFLLRREVRLSAQRDMTGAVGQMRVPASFLESVQVPIPPCREQLRIIATLDGLFSDLEAGLVALDCVREKLKLYRASLLNAAMDGALAGTVAPYDIRPIREGIASLSQGWSPKCENHPSMDHSTWGVIKTTAIQPLRFLEEHNKQLPETLEPRPHLELMRGDLLVTRAGPRSRVGIACRIRHTRPKLILCDKAYRVRCKHDELLPEFLEIALNSPRVVDQLAELKTGINDSGVNLTQERFGELLVPYPSIVEQRAIIDLVDDQLSVIDHLEADLDAKLQSAQSLRQAILHHAFTGRLVPQDPNDEPASELLKRIAAKRDCQSNGTQRSSSRRTSTRTRKRRHT